MKKPLSGAQRRKLRVARGLPRLWPGEKESRHADDLRRGKRRWAEYGERVAATKIERGCVDCGYNARPAALQFDHRPGEQKLGIISRLSSRPWEIVALEMAKCDVVCANCHSIRTASRKAEKLGRPLKLEKTATIV